MTLSKTKSKYNGVVEATLSGFAPDSTVTLRWPDHSTLAAVETDATGHATASFRTPLAAYGDYEIEATGKGGARASATLAVIPRIMLAPESVGPPGTTFRVYFYGFGAGERVEIRWYDLNGTSYDVLATVTIAANGRASKLVAVPSGSGPGAHTVRGSVIGVSRSASTVFTVTAPPPPAEMVLSKEKSKYNGWIAATLSGFAPNEAIDLRWSDGTVLSSVAADGNGDAVAGFRTPLVALGTYEVDARGAGGRTATAELRVIPRIMLAPESAGPTGYRFRVYFYGFASGERVRILWATNTSAGEVELDTVTIAENGRASKIVFVPDDATRGEHTIRGRVIGVSRSASTTFTVTGVGAAGEPTATFTATPTPEVAPTATFAPSPTPIATPTVAPTPTPTPMPTTEPTPTELPTLEPTATIVPTPVPTETPEPTATPVPAETPTEE
jgi:hypothetical protein